MKYRREIDGLRALAVVPVILFHAGFETWSGGYIGVDVFFVISGYLITTILIEDIENERFSLLRFYERRARRILPALYFVIFVVSLFAILLMLPWYLKEFGQSVVATVLFLSNIFFYLENDYWAQSSEFLPLIHTWSIAVEEQFYICFPIFLFFAWRYGRSVAFWIIVIIALLSMLLCEWSWRNYPIANFYLAPTRAWELLSGSITAFVAYKRVIKGNNLLSLIGLTFIFLSIFLYDDTTPFPSIYTLAPVLGVVLLILYAEENTLVAKLLSSKALVGVGLVSYSAYLWHQPILAFSRLYLADADLSNSLALMMVFMTFLAASLSYRYIEQPFRKPNIFSRKVILYFSAIPLLTFFAFGLVLHNSEGLRSIKYSFQPPETVRLITNLEQQKIQRKTYWKNVSTEIFPNNQKTNILFLGDSIANDLFVASSLSVALKEIANFRQLYILNECMHNIDKYGNILKNVSIGCEGYIENLSSSIFSESEVVVIANAWKPRYVRNLSSLLAHSAFDGKKIILYQFPGFTPIDSIILGSKKMDFSTSGDQFKSFIYQNKFAKSMTSNAIIQAISDKLKLDTIDGYSAFCVEKMKQCSLFSSDGDPYLIDAGHLSRAGSLHFEKWITETLIRILKK